MNGSRGWIAAEQTDCVQGWIIAKDGWQPRIDGTRGWIANGAMGKAVAIVAAMAMDGAMVNNAAVAIDGGVAFDEY